jgi:ABC-2 type transport system ATP-binding protein
MGVEAGYEREVMPAAIETEQLTKDYRVGFWRPRPYRALNALSLQVEAGEVFGFLGPNGAGKSTTLKLLMQLIYPSSGHARILGRPLGDVSVRQRIGYLAENPYFYDYLTAEEVLTYFARLFGMSAHDARARTTQVLDEVGIAAERRMRLRSFSKGMLQRVGLAQAIINHPEVIFLDEPMSGLDPLGRRDVRDLILRLRADGRTVFFSSHILSDAETLCSRVAILAQGTLMAVGRVNEIVAFEPKGWELIVAGVDAALEAYLAPRARALRPLAHGRYAVDLAGDAKPEQLMAELAAKGVRVESLNPVRDTLEDYFMQAVSGADPRKVAV